MVFEKEEEEAARKPRSGDRREAEKQVQSGSGDRRSAEDDGRNEEGMVVVVTVMREIYIGISKTDCKKATEKDQGAVVVMVTTSEKMREKAGERLGQERVSENRLTGTTESTREKREVHEGHVREEG